MTEYPQCSIMTKLEGANEQLLIVGTKVGCKSKFEASEGRLLVYTISDTGKTSLQCEYVVDGAALNMCEFQGKLAVTIQGKVQSDSTHSLGYTLQIQTNPQTFPPPSHRFPWTNIH